MPGAITNTQTPKDQNGDLIADGKWYLLYRGRSHKPQAKVLVCEDPDEGELICKGKESDLWQRVNEMDPSVRWELCEETDQ